MAVAARMPGGTQIATLPARALEVTPYVRAVQDTDRERRTVAHMLGMLNAAVPGRTVAMEPLDRRGNADGGGTVLRTGEIPVPPEMTRREYLSRYHADDPLHPRRQVDTDVTVLSTGQVGGPSTLARTMFGGEFLAEHRFEHVLRMFLRDEGRMFGAVMIARTAGEGEFRERELAFLRRAHPFIEHALACARALAAQAPADDALDGAGLTSREQEVARLAAAGLRSREIAHQLVVSEATVKTHLKRIFAKVGVRTRTELAALLRPATA
jgi:DNA-binding CsgD family transcriptional regulator